MLSLLMNLKSFSQNSSDTSVTCLPNKQLRIAAYKIMKGALDAQKVELLSSKVDTLQSIANEQAKRITLKDSTILLYQQLDLSWKKTEANYKEDIRLAEKQYAEEKKNTDAMEKKYKGARRKTVFVGITGVLVGIVVKTLFFPVK